MTTNHTNRKLPTMNPGPGDTWGYGIEHESFNKDDSELVVMTSPDETTMVVEWWCAPNARGIQEVTHRLAVHLTQ